MGKQNFKGVPESNWVVGPCQTEEIAKQVLAVAHAYGWKWADNGLFIDNSEWKRYWQNTCYGLLFGEFAFQSFYQQNGYAIISPETFLSNNPMPGEKAEEKTRKPGVKYTLEDWKKEADSCRKRAEYWKKNAERRVNENTIMLSKLQKLQLDLDHTNKNYTILQTENKVLKESNVELRGTNETLTVQHNTLLSSYDFLKKERDTYSEELKTVKGHFELQTKGVKALEEDARLNRVEIQLLKSDFETKNTELQFLEEDYNCLLNIQKWTKVVGWVGWIGMFLCMAFIAFYKG